MADNKILNTDDSNNSSNSNITWTWVTHDDSTTHDDDTDDDANIKTWGSYTEKVWNSWITSDDDENEETMNIEHDWFTFVIQKHINEIYSELVQLVLNTEAMDNDEKQYWFDIMPSMLDEQIDRLYDILETERVKLADLDTKYQEQIRLINQNHLTEWQEEEIKKNKDKIALAEKSEKKENPDDILWMMDV